MESENKTVEGLWNARQDDPFFNGHFPGRPILPAVATIQHAFHFLKDQLHTPGLKLVEVKSAKFASPIVPNMSVKMKAAQLNPKEWEMELIESDSEKEIAQLHFIVG